VCEIEKEQKTKITINDTGGNVLRQRPARVDLIITSPAAVRNRRICFPFLRSSEVRQETGEKISLAKATASQARSHAHARSDRKINNVAVTRVHQSCAARAGIGRYGSPYISRPIGVDRSVVHEHHSLPNNTTDEQFNP